MGTTLSNGVYLPDEGERNCYAGLKVNWEILNQKVADISALQLAIAGALHREIVESLPTTDIDPNTIYMILSGTSATENVYNEFMYVNNAWELIGTSATDLTNYYTKSEVDGKLLLKANASDLTSHTGDTTIHVTASDKTKWTNSANTHVLRLALSALTPSTSNNSFSNLDDSTALKVGDKVMDTAGVLFEVTAIDTQNSTFTIGTALIDLAQDSDVVHKSGNETIAGIKTFSDDITLQGTTTPVIKTISNIVQDTSAYNGSVSWVIRDKDNLNNILESSLYKYSAKSIDWQLKLTGIHNGVSNTKGIRFTLDPVDNVANFIPIGNNNTSLGNSSTKWKDVYATNYYYGSNNVEFSTKFVTTDTAQTISGAKTFSDNLTIYNNDSSQTTKNLIISSSKIQVGDTSANDLFGINFNAGASYVARVTALKDTAGTQNLQLNVRTKDSSNNLITSMVRLRLFANGNSSFESDTDNIVSLGSSSYKFKDVQTYKVNALEPSSLSLPVFPSQSSWIDISSYITDMTGSVANLYTPPANGYITFSATGNQVQIFSDYGLQSKFSIQSGSTIRGYHPVLKNESIKIYMLGTGIEFFRFIPCQGNV